MAEWELWVHDAITGAPIERFESAGSGWSTAVAGGGTVKETVVVNDAERPWKPGQVAEVFRPNAHVIARWWGGAPVCAHKIEDWDYDRSAGTVEVSGVELIGEADWRMIDGVGGGDRGSTFVIEGRSPSGAVRATLARMMQFGGDWAYPIDLPADGPGGVSGRWEFWEKYRISDILKQIEDIHGVETYLRPYGTADGSLRFEAMVASQVSTGLSAFHLDAEESPLAGVHYATTGKAQVTGLLGTGNGTGQDQETKWGAGIALVPIRDTKRAFPDLTGDALQSAVNAYYYANTTPLTQWSVGSFTIGDEWEPAHALPGRLWRLESHGDPVIPDGEHLVRVIKTSGDNGPVLNVEVQDAAS